MTRLHSFQGGIRFLLDHDDQSDQALRKPIQTMPLPARLRFSLLTRSGELMRTVVSLGDTVVHGQVLALAEDTSDVPLLASAKGIIESIGTELTLKTAVEDDKKLFSPPVVSPPSAIVQKLHALGVRGLGGAAYASFAKLDSANGIPIDTLIINAAECEPLICCDQALIREHACDIVTGIAQLAKLCKAQRCIIAIEDCMTTEIQLLNDALANTLARATTTKQNTCPAGYIRLVPIPTIYPAGSEKLLIRVLTGHETASNQLPRDKGILCFNIATALSVKQALLDHQPQVDRVITITGSGVSSPHNVRVRFGTRLDDLLSWLDITPALEASVIMGGPMTGVPVAINTTSVTAATNCIIVNQPVSASAIFPCIRCGDCDKVCPAGLLPQQLHWFCSDGNLADAENFHLSACIECGCCDYVCPSNIDLTPQFRQAKSDGREKHRLAGLAARAQARFETRAHRLEQKEALRQRKLQQRKATLEKKRLTKKTLRANKGPGG